MFCTICFGVVVLPVVVVGNGQLGLGFVVDLDSQVEGVSGSIDD